ncbi:MAG TPA: hypothetical protein VHB20_12325 [Verrucomicrobiae bacterium]|jgi:hypothetical protein|nr:hypothetical protein [Verrucomicrobiae bacterium]
MTRIIFETEIEVCQCDCEEPDAAGYQYAEPDLATLFAHTQASLNGRSGVLRIEQHCYLRQRGEVRDQPWVAPKIFLEPALATRQEMTALAEAMHRRFVEDARKQIPERFTA